MAKKIQHGKRFEEDFLKSIPARCDVTRLKDGGGWSNATNMRFTSNNPCDFIVFSEDEFGSGTGTMYMLELKSVKGKSMPFSNIKEHQLKSLCSSGTKGVAAKFIINFRATNETFMMSAKCMLFHMDNCGRMSLSLEHAREIGRKIKQTLKISRYRYELEWL